MPLSLVRISGGDALAWLQGQVTNDLRSLQPGGSIEACLCKPTGQLEAVLRIFSYREGLGVECEPAGASALLDRAERFVIMEDVAAELLDWHCLSIQGPTAEECVRRQFPSASGSDVAEAGERLVLRSDQCGMGGWNLWSPPDANLEVFGDLPAVSLAALEIAAFEAGIPKQGRDWTERTLPPELGPAFERRTVSYGKGCYTGQEVLMRIHSRGHTNRTWMALLADAPMEIGIPIAEEGGNEVGAVTAAFLSPRFGPIGGAMIRNEAAIAGGSVQAGAACARLAEFPLI